MKRTFLLFTFFILSFSTMQAQQDYHVGFGVRFGKFNNGVTFKEFFQSDQNIAIEAQLYHSLIANTYGYTAKAFISDQFTFKIPWVQLPIDFIIGAGGQGGYFPYDPSSGYGYYKIVDGKPDYYSRNVFTMGIAANIGLEYKLKRLPFTIGIDAVPAYEFYHNGADEGFDFGADFRYVIR